MTYFIGWKREREHTINTLTHTHVHSTYVCLCVCVCNRLPSIYPRARSQIQIQYCRLFAPLVVHETSEQRDSGLWRGGPQAITKATTNQNGKWCTTDDGDGGGGDDGDGDGCDDGADDNGD